MARKEKWNKSLVIEVFQKLSKKWKSAPTRQMLIKKGYRLLATYAIPRYFKNFENLYKELKISAPRKHVNHKWTRKKTVDALIKFCHSNSKLIEETSISKAVLIMKMSALMNAVQKFGGLRAFNRRNKLGLKLKAKKWTRAKIIQNLQILHQNGHIITQSNLIKLGKNDLVGAIYKFGNLTILKKAAGIPVKNYRRWTDNKIKRELKSLMAEHGFFPSITLLKMIGRQDLIHAIYNNGGLIKFARSLNRHPRTLFLSNDGHYLQSSYECIFDNILHKYHIPHQTHVRISKNHLYKCDFLIANIYIEITGYVRTGSNAYAIKMEKKIHVYKQLKKRFVILPQKMFCQRIEKIEQSVLVILKKMRCFKNKHTPPLNDISIKPKTYWANFSNVKKALAPLISKYRRMPTIKEMYEHNLASLANAIYVYHGTMYDIAQKLGLKSRQVSREFYTKTKTMLDYKKLCLIHKKSLTLKELYALNLRALAHAIIKYKGFQVIRKACKLQFSHRRVRPIECTPDEVIFKYKKICIKFRKFLTLRELREKGLTILASHMCQRGLSIYTVRKKTGLNYPMSKLPQGYYTVPEVVTEYKKLCKKYGYFISRRKALKVLPATMFHFVDRTVGLTKMKEMTGLNFG